jgi:hypothetical protein
MRKLFDYLAALSLLLCLLLVIVRVRSESTQNLISRTKGGQRIEIRSEKDTVFVLRYEGWPVEEPWTWLTAKAKMPIGPTIHSYEGKPQVEVYLRSDGRIATFGMVGLHLSAPMTRTTVLYAHLSDWILLTAVLPAIWMGVWLFRKYQKTSQSGRGFRVEPTDEPAATSRPLD